MERGKLEICTCVIQASREYKGQTRGNHMAITWKLRDYQTLDSYATKTEQICYAFMQPKIKMYASKNFLCF